MRATRERIYRHELERLLNDGVDGKEAERLAAEYAEDFYWELVDRGRQEAKDRQLER